MSIYDVILSADLVVVGSIEDPSDEAYTFNIEEIVHGTVEGSSISVQKWKEWTCDSRAFEIKKGQRLVLLLRLDSLGYSPINASTGEIPIVNDSIALRYEPLRPMPVPEFTRGVRVLRCRYPPAALPAQNEREFCSTLDWKAARKSDEFCAWMIRKIEDREARR